VLKRSPYYRRLRPELQTPFPADAWHDDKWAFFVFDLHNVEEAKDDKLDSSSRLVVFAVNLEKQRLEGVKVVAINTDLNRAEVTDLQDGNRQFSIPLPTGW